VSMSRKVRVSHHQRHTNSRLRPCLLGDFRKLLDTTLNHVQQATPSSCLQRKNPTPVIMWLLPVSM
jgi:hypothetical protein